MPNDNELGGGAEMWRQFRLTVCFAMTCLSFTTAGVSAQADEPSVSELLEQIGADDQSVSERATRMLAQRDPASLSQADVDTLVQAVAHDKEAVQEAAVWRLLGIRDDERNPLLDRLYDKKPKVTRKVKPQYPREARGIRGRVELEFVVNNSGRVGYVRVLRSIPILDDAAVKCIREWE